MAKLVFGMNQSLDGYVDHMAFAPSPTLFRHFIEEAQGQAGSVYGRQMYGVTFQSSLVDSALQGPPVWGHCWDFLQNAGAATSRWGKADVFPLRFLACSSKVFLGGRHHTHSMR